MIAYVKGKIIRKNQNSLVIVANDLGYEVYVSLHNFYKYHEGDEIELVTYLHTREDLIQLYGFENWEEREVFLLLINVSGVGPKGAIGILSNITIDRLKEAILTENIGILTKLPGVGKKTAQRLIIELKDKIPETTSITNEISDENLVAGSDLLQALISLGYQSHEVKQIIPKLLKDNPNADEAFLIKRALQILAKI
ncbi:MAG: Holliday junction branch migration protein RuvA [Peptococcales bacterium]|jgi:Holliday junction DNA helicase RuvA